MAHRIEVVKKVPDTRAEVRKRQIHSAGFFDVEGVKLVDVYTTDADLPREELKGLASMLVSPVSEEVFIDKSFTPDFTYAVEIGFLPGVTDNVGNTVRDEINDAFNEKFEGQTVYASQLMLLKGNLTEEYAQRIGEILANPLIERIQVKNRENFMLHGGMGATVPRVKISEKPKVDLVDILNSTDEKLAVIGKQGITNLDGTRKGPLALNLQYMRAIQKYFRGIERNPTDVELESIAQTWSEHCKHTIFADPIDEIKEGLYKKFIKGATNLIRQRKGLDDFCVSLFTDNSGAIAFDNKYLFTFKVETHNSPSALDPFGGSITGIVGVNRDTIGFGLGAKPVVNLYGFCLGDPKDKTPIFRNVNQQEQMLSPRRIMDGVIQGVNSGGNQSGIPTPQGFIYFNHGFKGKPLVFVGTGGLMPREINGKLSHEKSAQFGDYIVMVGGRVGKDGIHGATFSSEAMDSESPATAVQIGDPITQKKLSDVIVKEARDRGLYTSITDNGAGGLSCSVAEMAKESGGFKVDLEKVPLKYPGLQPWEIWISESQERMTLSVPKDKWKKFSNLMQRRGVEATVIGEFTDSGKCIVDYNGENVMDIDIEFLHNGLPPRPMKTYFTRTKHEEPDFTQPENLTETFHEMLKRKNIASFEFISQQYDHEVQGNSVIKPLQGKGRVNGDATVIKPVLDSDKGVVLSHGINPSYSDIDIYNMAAAAIDTAIRNAVAVGGKLEKIALLDNFCWCSSDEPERLGQLKRAAQACFDVAVAYETPFISGKDSMFNDFRGFDENGSPIKISIPPTLLISSLAVMDDVRKSISLDAKFSGDVVYVLGETKRELGGSEYYAMMGEKTRGEKFVGNDVPEVDVETNSRLYRKLSQAIGNELIASAQSINRGGLVIALAKTAMGGKLGLGIGLDNLGNMREDDLLYSESQGRIIVTVSPDKVSKFEEIMKGSKITKIGITRNDDKFEVYNKDNLIIGTNVEKMLESYKSTFAGY